MLSIKEHLCATLWVIVIYEIYLSFITFNAHEKELPKNKKLFYLTNFLLYPLKTNKTCDGR